MNGVSTQSESKSDAPRTIVALTGFMGSGKTTVGRELAARLGWEFVDLDELIETQERTTIAELFGQRGEAAFREIEHATLATFLDQCSRPSVLALGGGTSVQAINSELLRRTWIRTVFLDVDFEVLAERCGVESEQEAENARPLAEDRARFQQLHELRLPMYRQADLTVRAAGRPADEVASIIVAMLHHQGGV